MRTIDGKEDVTTVKPTVHAIWHRFARLMTCKRREPARDRTAQPAQAEEGCGNNRKQSTSAED